MAAKLNMQTDIPKDFIGDPPDVPSNCSVAVAECHCPYNSSSYASDKVSVRMLSGAHDSVRSSVP